MTDPLIPAREVFRALPLALIVAFYVVAVAAMGTFAYGVWRRIAKYASGRPAHRLDRLWRRIADAIATVAAHRTLRKRNAWAGWSHFMIFWGFAALFAGTTIIVIDQDLVRPIIPALQFWKGDFYRWYSLALDLAGVAFLAGLALMALRRVSFGRARLDYTRPDRDRAEYDRTGYVHDDWIFLALLFLIGLTGYLVEGLRISADRPPFEVWSVVGWRVADLFDAAGMTPADANGLHRWAWWLHGVLALAFIAWLPWSKAVHLLIDGFNLLLRDPLAGRRLPAIPETAESMGYRSLSDLTWKELLDLDACTKCGRCHEACPARAGGWALSPRDLVLELREQAAAAHGGNTVLHETRRTAAAGEASPLARPATLWSCTTCLACVETCPVGVEHVPLMVQMRRNLVEQGTLDRNLQATLERIVRCGNSFNEPEETRGNWTEGLGFPIKDARTEAVEYLWFVGDYASFHPEARRATRAAARVFHRAGIDFGILYASERNAGNDVRRVGEEGLFQMLVELNQATLAEARYSQIITTDPHSLNTLTHEYPHPNGAPRIRHATQLLAELIDSGRLPLERRLEGVATYHDPCHLSRYAGVTEEPRRVLRALGLELVEMPRHGANSFCCGAGGGRIWMTDTGKAERPSEQRLREAMAIPGLRHFVTACPKDVAMFGEAARAPGLGAAAVQVRDLFELVDEALAPAAAPVAGAGTTATDHGTAGA